MSFADGNNTVAGADTNAIMTQHFAQKCIGDALNAVMSQHCAQKSLCTIFDNRIYYRYF